MSKKPRRLLSAHKSSAPAVTAQAEYTSPSTETLEAMNAEQISKTLSPSRLASLVASSKKGDSLALVTLALEMREEDASFGGNLRTRKLAILNQPRSISEGDHPKAAELVRELFARRYFGKILIYLAEAIEVGYAVIELVWGQNDSGYWLPRSAHRIDPRRVGYNPQTEAYYWRNFADAEDKAKVIEAQGKDALRYMVYQPDEVLMPHRGALARLAAYAFMAKRFGLNDWISFLSSAGMPVRVGRYERNAEKEERAVLKRALQHLSSDKAAAIPKNTEIQFVETKGSNGAGFKNLAEYLDKQLAVAVLGQTLTSGTDKSGGYALGQVHDNVRLDILKADCVSLTAEIQELVDKVCLVNFGPATAPKISIKPKVQKDLQKLSGVVSTLGERGLAVPKAWIYEEFGIPEPKDGEEVLGAEGPLSPQAKQTSKDEVNSLDSPLGEEGRMGQGRMGQGRMQYAPTGRGVLHTPPDTPPVLDAIVEEGLAYEYRPAAENAVVEAINSSRSFEQLKKKLARIALWEPEKGLTQALALAATKGALLGEHDG